MALTVQDEDALLVMKMLLRRCKDVGIVCCGITNREENSNLFKSALKVRMFVNFQFYFNSTYLRNLYQLFAVFGCTKNEMTRHFLEIA